MLGLFASAGAGVTATAGGAGGAGDVALDEEPDKPLGPAMKDGVLDTALGARVERKGAGSDRICTFVGRRRGCACPWGEEEKFRAGLGWREDGEAVGGALGGSVTERFITTLRGRRAGLFAGARDPRRGAMVIEPLAWGWGLTGRGRRKGFGVGEIRWEGEGRAAAAVERLPSMVD